ncbi:tumor necrosis factor receptor superfamily member 1B-like isoform X2 [Buteo buteo]|uniref:tumor necrosis factor receptor superfamily member 1B-like isoform X2 n=1 Tax=Buteo buteo TaxID=30397 RepID=UPI003EB7E32D
MNIHCLIHHSLHNAKIPALNSMRKDLINVAASALQVNIRQRAAVTLRTQSAVPVDLTHIQQSGIGLLSALPAHHPAGKDLCRIKRALRHRTESVAAHPMSTAFQKYMTPAKYVKCIKNVEKVTEFPEEGQIAQIQNVNLVLLALFHMRNLTIPAVYHIRCKSVAIPGNRMNDTVCSDSGTAVATVLPHTILNLLLTQSSASSKPEIITRPVILNSVPEMSHIIGSVAGPLLLVLIISILGYCLVSKKKALVYSPTRTEADSPFSPTEKQCDKKVRNTGSQNSSSSEQEEQHLLETSESSSSSLNNPTGSARVSVRSNKNNEKKETEGFQQQHSAAEGCKLYSGDRHNSASSEHSGNGGTQVNVTCIVKVCSPDCSSQLPEQTSSTSMDYGNAPYYSPTREEIPLSKEENPLKKGTEIKSSVENEDNLLQDLLSEEKKFPLGIQDAGMKTS